MVGPERPVWLVGQMGMLGQQLKRSLTASGIPVVASDREVDIRDIGALQAFCAPYRFSWIVNCAAYTAVDAAENDWEGAYALNALGPENLSRIAQRQGCPLIHFSTDYVFDGAGTRPHRESDPTAPQSVYGLTKRAGEEAVQFVNPDHLIIRISWLYGVHGKNFVETMLRLMGEKGEVRVVNDQIGAPTYAAALAQNICDWILRPKAFRGIFHCADQGEISWYDFACAIAEEALRQGLLQKAPLVQPIHSSAFPTPAKRPTNSRFDTERIRAQLGFTLFPWRDNLNRYFEERRQDHAKL